VPDLRERRHGTPLIRIAAENFVVRVAAARGRLPMVGPSAIGKAFGLAAATQRLTGATKNSNRIGMRQTAKILASHYCPVLGLMLRITVFRSMTALTLFGSVGTVLSATTSSSIVTLRTQRVARSM